MTLEENNKAVQYCNSVIDGLGITEATIVLTIDKNKDDWSFDIPDNIYKMFSATHKEELKSKYGYTK